MAGRHNAHLALLDRWHAHIVQAFQGGKLPEHRLLPDELLDESPEAAGQRIHQAMQLLSQ